MWAEREDRDYIFVMASLTSPTLSIVEQESLAQYLNDAIAGALSSEPDGRGQDVADGGGGGRGRGHV